MSAKGFLARLFKPIKLLGTGQAQARSKAEIKIRVYRAAEDRWYDVKPKRRFLWRQVS